MKKTMLLAAGALLLSGCADRLERAAGSGESSVGSFPVEEARALFEEVLAGPAGSRAEEEPQNLGFFMPGDVEPSWAEAREVPVEEFARVDVPVDASYEFFRFVAREETDLLDLVAIPRTLVVMKDPGSDRRAVYFCHYLADDDFADWYAARPRQEWIDGPAKKHFTGIVLYTTMEGRIAAAGRCDHGRVEEGIFFGAWASEREAALDRFADLLGFTYVARCRTGMTRGVNDNNPIDLVVIIGERQKPEDPFGDFDWDLELPPIPEHSLRGGSSGGGGGSSSGTDGGGTGSSTSPCPKVQTKDDGVLSVLRELDKDCMGATLFKSLSPRINVIPDAGFGSGCRTIVRNTSYWSSVPVQEFTIELGSLLKDVALLEELIHVYQYTGRPNMKDDRMNFEVEAKLAWYMYRQRIGNMEGISGALGGRNGIKEFDRLSKCYKKKDLSSPEFYDAYDAAVGTLRNIRAYSDAEKYPVNRNARNFENLEKLMKNC